MRPSAALPWVAFPAGLEDPQFTADYSKLAGQSKGAALLGCWMAILRIAGTSFPRGVLVSKQGKPLDALSLSRRSHLPSKLFEDAIPFFVNGLGWLEPVSHNDLAEMIEIIRARK